MKTIVIKIGTNVITQENGLLNDKVMQQIVQQVTALKKAGQGVIMISSGAMGAGRSIIKIDEKSNKVVKRQILAAVGQVKLIQKYSDLFQKHGYACAQVLATKEDFRDREHYLNMKNCFQALLHDEIIPIVNENDVISVSELMFTDNDELAGMIASMMNASQLILLTNVDGIFDKDPAEADAKLLTQVTTKSAAKISSRKSSFGRGGMKTKQNIGLKLAKMGIETFIVNGHKADCITKPQQGTHFPTSKASSKTAAVKKWIASSEGKARIYIDAGAEKVLRGSKPASLLPIGITKIQGEFAQGDILNICNSQGQEIALGKAQYSHKTALKNLGQKGKKALVHYDYLTLI